MPLVSETGGAPGCLCVLSGLDENQLWPAIQELRSRSLLEVRSSLHEKTTASTVSQKPFCIRRSSTGLTLNTRREA
ncbi:MAG: hypothetical protein R6X34_05445 [Chloroflexota bacterium]